MKVIFEDNHLLVVDKPAGLLTQASGTDQENLQDMARAWLKEKYQKPGNVFLEPLHRLDKPVSGIVLFAKTSKALSRLNEATREKLYQKTYVAVVEGRLPHSEGSLEHYLVHDDFVATIVDKGVRGAKLARLHYRVVDKDARGTLVEIELETGRYHQIRAQFATIGCPIVGDRKYGSKSSFANGAIALHHSRLVFLHPVSGQEMVCEAEVPESWFKKT